MSRRLVIQRFGCRHAALRLSAWRGWITGWALILIHVMGISGQPAHAGQAAPQAVEVGALTGSLGLGMRAQMLEDRSGRWTLADVRSAAQAWQLVKADTVNVGFSTSAWWLRARLVNSSAGQVTRLIEVGSALQDYVDIYVLRGVGPARQVAERVLTGDRRPFAQRPMPTRTPTVPLRFDPGEEVEVYVRLATHDGLHEAVPLVVWAPAAHAGGLESETLVYGLYYGALAAVLLYNLFLYISTRQRGFGRYTAYLLAFVLWSFTFRGYSLKFLWPEWPAFNNQVLAIGASASFFTFGIFMMTYLNTHATLPRRLHRALVVFTWVNLLTAVPAVLNHYALSFALSIPFGLALMLSSLVAGALLLRQGYRPARYYAIAFTLLAVGATLYYLRLVGLVPANGFTEYFLQIGSALQALLLAFGLADQMNMLKAAKLRAERDARTAQTALSHELESLVSQRTRELEEANQRLTELATVDELTGAYNRRYFNASFDASLARCARQAEVLAFCLLDVDNFKLYNDHYGHQAGDVVLQRISVTLKDRLRRAGDQFFRLGGEEFGVLLDAADPIGHVQPFVDSLRAAIESLAIPHQSNPGGVVTASFGLVILTASGSAAVRLEDLYAQADKLLYEAKAAGRNCVKASIVTEP